MAVTIGDIAKHLGVTKTTVSKVLNHKAGEVKISERTRQRVHQAIQELDYRPSLSARALAKGRTFCLGFICGDIYNPYFAELVSIALRESEARGYHLLISLTEGKGPENDLACLASLYRGRVDGIVMISNALQQGTELYDKILRDQFPLVLLQYPSPGISSVCSDWQTGMDQAVEYLKQEGHVRQTYLTTQTPGPVKSDKETSFHLACVKYGVEPQILDGPDNLDVNGYRNLGRDIAFLPDRPGVIIVHSDSLALSFINGLREGGLEVPQDICIVGIDGTRAGEDFFPPLTSIAQDRRQTVVSAIDMILQKLENKDTPPKNILLPTELVIRDSA